MKKALTLLIVSFLLSASLYSQTIEYEIKVRYIQDASGTLADITVTVKTGDPDFTYFMMTNDPMNGAVLLKSEPTRKKNYVFKNIKPGKYFIKIEDRLGMPVGKTVVIQENENSSN
jgi:hypothetical protein